MYVINTNILLLLIYNVYNYEIHLEKTKLK